jgi:hypothetical protein
MAFDDCFTLYEQRCPVRKHRPKGKTLELTKKGIAQAIVNDIELLIHESGKGSIIASKVDKILDEKTQDKLLYSYLEWAAAYIIVHEQKKLWKN